MKNFQKLLNQAIEDAELTYVSDISWYYQNKINKHLVDVRYSQDSNGFNSVDSFCVKDGDGWTVIEETEEQIKRMWQILNETEYQGVQEPINDLDYYGSGYKQDYGL